MADQVSKKFIICPKKSRFPEELEQRFYNCITFIQDTGEIYTHGQYFSTSIDDKNKIIELTSTSESLLKEVSEISESLNKLGTAAYKDEDYFFSKASAKELEDSLAKYATKDDLNLYYPAEDGVNLYNYVHGTDLALTKDLGELASANYVDLTNLFFTISSATKLNLYNLNTAAFKSEDYFYTAESGANVENRLTIIENTKVDSIIDSNSISTIKNENTYSLDLKISEKNKGNIELGISEDGLYANVISSNDTAGVVSVSTKDDILTVNSNGLLTVKFSLNYNSSNSKLEIIGNDDKSVYSSVDVTDFLKDLYIQSAELFETAEENIEISVPYLKLTFNNSSIEPIRVSVKDLMTLYDGNNLLLSDSYLDSETYKIPVKGDSVDTAISKLSAGLNLVNNWLEL